MDNFGKITIDDVAKYCSCSIATVSRVLNRDKRVRPETAKIVEKAMEVLGYQPNSMARALSAGKTGNIAVVMPENWQAQPYYINLLDAILDIAEAKEYNIILKKYKYADSVIELVSRKQIDGIIIRNMEENDKYYSFYKKMERMDFPFILIGQPVLSYPFLKIDNIGGGRIVASYIADMGYKTVLYISGPENHIDSIDRLAGLKIGLFERKYNHDALKTVVGDYSTDSGYNAAKKFFASDRADVIFAANDRMALGVFFYCRENNIQIPQDLGIIGFDNNFFSEFLSPPLTTVKPPMYEIGILAMESLANMITNKNRPNPAAILPVELIIRQSCIKQK